MATRLAKAGTDGVDAVVAAVAALERLGQEKVVSERLDPLSALIAACNFVTLAALARFHGLCSRKTQHLCCCDAQSVSAQGQRTKPLTR